MGVAAALASSLCAHPSPPATSFSPPPPADEWNFTIVTSKKKKTPRSKKLLCPGFLPGRAAPLPASSLCCRRLEASPARATRPADALACLFPEAAPCSLVPSRNQSSPVSVAPPHTQRSEYLAFSRTASRPATMPSLQWRKLVSLEPGRERWQHSPRRNQRGILPDAVDSCKHGRGPCNGQQDRPSD